MIDEKLVRHIAKLARIGIGDAEVAQFARELGAILAYMEQLEKVDVSGIEPIAHITGRSNVSRSDAPAEDGGVLPPNIDGDLLEEEAPGHVDGEVRVPRILQ